MPKQQPADDLEARRQVTRELNEATKDAQAMLRRLEREVKELDGQLIAKANEIVAPMIDAAVKQINAKMTDVAEQVREWNRELVACNSADELFEKMAGEVAESLAPAINQAACAAIMSRAEEWLAANCSTEVVAASLLKKEKVQVIYEIPNR